MKKENRVVKYHQVILNSIQDLQRRLLLFINNKRGRSRIKYGMTSLFNNGGFTLIELLVVVLIIGILAAVAVPQYQLAVAKARVKRNLPVLRSVLQASQAYYLANGKYTCDVDQLDVSFNYVKRETKEGSSNVCDTWYDYTTKDGDVIAFNGYAAYCHMADIVDIDLYSTSNEMVCYSIDAENPLGEKLCKSLGKLRTGVQSVKGTNVYDF